MVTVVTFCLTVTFPCFIFLSILIRPPEKTFYPLTAHTTRLLMVADLRLLSKYIERYTINYYGPLLCWDQPNFISLSWIKLIFEDLVQFIIQILFLYVIGGINALVITIALTLTGISMLSSFLIIYKKYTSNLQENDLKEVNDFIHENGLTDSSMNIGIAVNFIKCDIEKRLNKKSKSIYQKITIIGQKLSRGSSGHEALTQDDRPDEEEKSSRISERSIVSEIISEIQEDSSID